MNITDLSVRQLQQAATIKAKIERLQARLNDLLGQPTKTQPHGRRKMSVAARAKIAAAQKARWARFRAKKK